MSYKFRLPPSRIVSGSPTFKQDKEYGTNKPKEKPNWFMMVACAKDPNPNGQINLVLKGFMEMAWYGYAAMPDIQKRIAAGFSSGFAWKIEDGDHPDNIGKEGRAGCWLIKFSTTFGVMNCCDSNGNTIDPALVKCGYYVDVTGNAEINGNKDNTAGIFINPEWVRLLGSGVEIRSGPTAAEAFKDAPAVLPPGATQFTPGAPSSAPPPQTFTPPAGQVAGPGFAQQQQLPPPQPQQQQQPTAEQIAAHYRVQHYPGHRYNPQTNAYEPDVAPPPQPQPPQSLQPQPQPPAGNGFASGQGAAGYGTPAPAGSTPPPGFPASASPSSAPGGQPAFNPSTVYPGATPHPGFLTPQ